MKDTLMKQCLEILNSEEVKKDLKTVFSPLTDAILIQLYPYVYVIILLVFLIFVLILAILVLLVSLLRNKNIFPKALGLG